VGVTKRNLPAASFKLPTKHQQGDAGTHVDSGEDGPITVEKVLGCLQSDPKNRRVDLWSKEFGVPTEDLIELVKKSEGRLKLTGVARWLKAA
jgi:hypothetical protein